MSRHVSQLVAAVFTRLC